MKFYIKHSMTGRLRVHMDMKHMSFKQADIFEYYIKILENLQHIFDIFLTFFKQNFYIIQKI